MNRTFLALLLLASTSPALANSAELAHDRLTVLAPLSAGHDVTLTGKTHDQYFSATIQIDADGRIGAVKLIQNGQTVRMPDSCCAALSGAERAWVEERGSLTAIVIEGKGDGKTWRLALEYHEKQLWLKRLSQQGESLDQFVFYDRKTLQPSKSQFR